MDLAAIKLVPVIVDSPEIARLYNDTITFYVSQDISIEEYFNIYKLQSTGINNNLIAAVRSIVRDSSGNLILKDDETLPAIILPAVVRGIVYELDKVRNQELNPLGDWTTAHYVTVGAMAKEYGVLPHVIRDTATTYDLMIFDVTNTWEKYQMDKASGKGAEMQPDQLADILKSTRKKYE